MNGSGFLDVTGTFENLRDAYFRYYDTPFGLADKRLQEERRQLMDQDGGTYRTPLVEVRPEYATTGRTLADSAREVGAANELGEFAERGLIPEGRELYGHQEQALRTGVARGENMVITAGTGSGKTEAFLLPIISNLLEESRGWGGSPGILEHWWESEQGEFLPQRVRETGHPSAVRAMVLYPMNALVDDQLTRLRQAFDSDDVRQWLDTHRNGHRFYFGKYTGTTPVTGDPKNKTAVDKLRRVFKDIVGRSAQAHLVANEPGKEDAQFFVPRLGGAEMLSRWDMIDSPPDILITNYSMLNVMLLRDREDSFFSSTREWLEDPDNVFTLVVDELHTYRGTSGTEVSYLLRNLKKRLGLDTKPEQLRILASSASLDAERDKEYLASFFDVPIESFRFVEGSITETQPGSFSDPELVSELATSSPEDAVEWARELELLDSIRDAFKSKDGKGVAKTVHEASRIVFPDASEEQGKRALENIFRGFAEFPSGSDPHLRAHYFFRNIPGVWACSDADCSEIPGGTYEGRTVGRLFLEPVSRCPCGARVLELLYCQNCGDVMLGGFVPEGQTQRSRFESPVMADVPDLAKLPDQVGVDRNTNNYIVYWPRATKKLENVEKSSWSAENISFEFLPSRLSPSDGVISNGIRNSTGWTFHVKEGKTSNKTTKVEALSPFPTKCPACGDDWEIKFMEGRTLSLTDPLRLRSPIRHMRTGFEKINQVLSSELANDLPEQDRKLIVFTDSRQDAAKLSAGISLRHYQDLLRLLLHEELTKIGSPSDVVDRARKLIKFNEVSRENREAWKNLRARNSNEAERLEAAWRGWEPVSDEELSRMESGFIQFPTIGDLVSRISSQLLSLGVNPGGPKASLQSFGKKPKRSWKELFNWRSEPPTVRGNLDPLAHAELGIIYESLREEVLLGLFSGAGRDFESLGLGWLTVLDDFDPADKPSTQDLAQTRSALRVLADQRRFFGLRDKTDSMPSRLKKLGFSLANNDAGGADLLALNLQRRASDAVKDYLIDPDKVVLRPRGEIIWRCSKCSRMHLTIGSGHCTKCFSKLGKESSFDFDVNDQMENYYSWKALNGKGRFRMNSAELTGQTDRMDAQSRQSRFQNVFLDNKEHSLPDGLDLLSVTTTMEAGVDIGSLSAIILGNMPPTRFNYQQRVGRAGRRQSPVAVALTVCRGRSHDEYYFDRPEKIANDPAPVPYLTFDRVEILNRFIRHEVLRQAFRETLSSDGNLVLSNNVHGQFGIVDEWSDLKPLLESWLIENRDSAIEAATALASRTSFEGVVFKVVNQCLDTLIEDIEDATIGTGSSDLSQRLAERGLLPMFGFPTSVRNFYLEKPSRTYPWPPEKTVSRELGMAVSQFSPMSQVVRDGSVYTAVGIADFKPMGGRVSPEQDPLGVEHSLDVCINCGFIDEFSTDELAQECPRCGAAEPKFRRISMREPLGFRSSAASDFDGNFSWSARAMSARALPDRDRLSEFRFGHAHIAGGPGNRYVINDNGGRQFKFYPVGEKDPWGGYVSAEAVAKELKSSSGFPLRGNESRSIEVSIGAVQPTDLMFYWSDIPVRKKDGIRLNVVDALHQIDGAVDRNDGRRAAWYSLAFLFRKVAAIHLDIEPQEIQAGTYSGQSSDGTPAMYAFLADSLENGAGFSSQLGSKEGFPAFNEAVDEFLQRLEHEDHSTECNGSCYVCLRDYGNMPFHTLLDWRLARDLFKVVQSGILNIDVGSHQKALDQWCIAADGKAFDFPRVAAAHFYYQGSEFAVGLKHALEASDEEAISPRLVELQSSIFARFPNIRGVIFIDAFSLDRDPRRVHEMAGEILAQA